MALGKRKPPITLCKFFSVVFWGVYTNQQTSSKLPANVFKIHVTDADTTPGRQFLRATAECFARLNHGLGVHPYVRLFVRLPHPAALPKRCMLGSRNLHRRLPQRLVFGYEISSSV